MVGLRQQLIWLVDARGLTEKEFKLVGLLSLSSFSFSTNQRF
jgi:hypothetical protein